MSVLPTLEPVSVVRNKMSLRALPRSKIPMLDIKDEHRINLDSEFMERFRGRQPEWGAVGYITYKRTYARPLPDGGTEEFWQTVQRVVEGVYTIQKWHCSRLGLPWSDTKAQRSAQEMFQRMWDFKFLPPGRGLWMMGTQNVERLGGAACNNCAFISTEHLDQDFSGPFCFLMDMSMLGVGVGGDCKGAGKLLVSGPVLDEVNPHMVEDSREGWVELVRRVLNSYAGVDTLPEKIDYSQVRPEGAPIKGFGGTASGPEPLMRLVRDIRATLDPLIGQPITSKAIVELFDKIGVCVVSGNVRRSAIIMLGEANDKEFVDLKDPTSLKFLERRLSEKVSELQTLEGLDAKYDGPPAERVISELRNGISDLKEEVAQHPLYSYLWASNNSLLATVGMDYTEAAAKTAANGEPGYFWLDTARAFGRLKDPANWFDSAVKGTNPCSEQSLESYELCCLVENFPSRHESYEDFQRTLKFSYLYAKTITLIPTHNLHTNAVMLRNRRIGCSMSGIIQAMTKVGRRTFFDWCDKGYEYLSKLDGIYADWLCVPRSKKKTSVKPSGTISLLPGVTPGIHFEHAPYYYRTIRISNTSPLLDKLARSNYRIEPDKYSPGTSVVYFPVKAEHFDRAKKDVSMWEQLEIAAQVQHYWADNQVSVTITFKRDEAKDIGKALELYETRLKSVSFLPVEDHNYEQAPYQEITADEYEMAVAELLPLDLRESQNEVQDRFCDGDKCLITWKPPS